MKDKLVLFSAEDPDAGRQDHCRNDKRQYCQLGTREMAVHDALTAEGDDIAQRIHIEHVVVALRHRGKIPEHRSRVGKQRHEDVVQELHVMEEHHAGCDDQRYADV